MCHTWIPDLIKSMAKFINLCVLPSYLIFDNDVQSTSWRCCLLCFHTELKSNNSYNFYTFNE